MTVSTPDIVSDKKTKVLCTPRSHYVSEEHLIEQVYCPKTRASEFVTCERGSPALKRSTQAEIARNLSIVPLESELIHKRRVLLPSDAESYGSTAALIAEIGAFLNKYLWLPPEVRPIVPYFILYTWIFERFETAPYLRFIGDLGVGKSRALQVIGSLCRHPFFAGGSATLAPIFRGLAMLGGATLVLDECDFWVRNNDDQEMMTLLRQGFQRGAGVLRAEARGDDWVPTDYDVFGPKVLGGRRNFPDAALESRCLRVHMQPAIALGHIPVEIPSSFMEEVTALQNKLLMWRFDHAWVDLREPKLPSAEPRLLQLYLPLASLVEDTEALNQLAAAIEALQSDLTESRREGDEGRVLAVIIEMAKERGAELPPHRFLVKDIAARVTQNYRRLGSKQIKAICLSFGLASGVKTSEGVTVYFDPRDLAHVFRRYGLDAQLVTAA
jgi:hypothetical protein